MWYEVHVTVDQSHQDAWLKLSERLGIKPLLIELSDGATQVGEHPLQLMCAAAADTDDEGARELVASVVGPANDAGIPILRVKLECQLDYAHHIEEFAYDECHMKLMMTPEEAKLLPQICAHAGVCASRNLFAPEAGLQKWYLTQRTYGESINASSQGFNLALAKVAEIFPAVRMEMERVVSDSFPNIDLGWTHN